jgi:hypothetical protein
VTVLSWERRLERKFADAKGLTGTPLSPDARAQLTVRARAEHAFNRNITGTTTGLSLGSLGFGTALGTRASVAVTAFVVAAAYAGGRYVARQIHDWIAEPPPAMPTIDETIAFIRVAHLGQTDKAGREYYHHPVAVMNRLPEGADLEVKLAALLHDVLEDTKYTRAHLRSMGYSNKTLNIVELVTQRPGDSRSYGERIATLIASANKDAILVKFADMSENTDPERLAALPPEVRKHLENKYTKPKQALANALS